MPASSHHHHRWPLVELEMSHISEHCQQAA
jgi:hypothetical protein